MNAREILRGSGLYVISDITMAGGRSYHDVIRDALMGGSRIIQLRDKTTPFEDLIRIGKQLKNLTAEFNALLIVNDNPYLAREINADGVHLGQMDIPVDIAREIVGDDKIIGLSTHSHLQVQMAAMSKMVDYIGIGPIFRTTTKRMEYPPVGLKILEWAVRGCSLPFVAIGGINRSNISSVLATGTKLVAMISEVMKSPDIQATTREFNELIRNGVA